MMDKHACSSMQNVTRRKEKNLIFSTMAEFSYIASYNGMEGCMEEATNISHDRTQQTCMHIYNPVFKGSYIGSY